MKKENDFSDRKSRPSSFRCRLLAFSLTSGQWFLYCSYSKMRKSEIRFTARAQYWSSRVVRPSLPFQGCHSK